jgi:hypothetical protein
VKVHTELNHLTLESMKGQVGTLSDGEESWTAMLAYYLAPPVVDDSPMRLGVTRWLRSS